MLVNKVFVDVNGQVIDSFKTVKIGKLTVTRAVNLMHKTAKIKATQRPTVSLDYAIPLDEPEFDFLSIGDDATITIEYENGKRTTFMNCSVGEIGEITFDEEKEAIRPIDFIAETWVEE